MKKSILAAFALLSLASCAKENSASEPSNNMVAATFTSASITRVADNAWETNDKIGITMTTNGTTTLADGNYNNIPYTVDAAGVSGTFSPDDETIYFPVDGSSVDFYAYYPYATLDANNDLAVDVSSQIFKDIDIVVANVVDKSKASPTVTFSDEDAFEHQLSKLTLTLKAGDGITDLTGLTTTIKGQYTTAKYNLYTTTISSESGTTTDMTAATTIDDTDKELASASAILIPTAGTASSSIVFSLDDNDYIWDTASLVLSQGSEHNYEVTITKTLTIVEGATISGWNDGTDGTGTAE